jgi:glycosyltransferase involved in cell wall biosynthesis
MISVIIPTYNRATLLASTLESIAGQTLPLDLYEVLIIDNGSTDNTRDVSNDFGTRLKNISYIFEENPGLHAARHRGLKYSKGNILVYADDDVRAFPSWLASIAECFEDDRVAMVGGKNIPWLEAAPPTWFDKLWEHTDFGKFMTCYSLLDFGEEVREINPLFIFGCNFSIRKSVLQHLGGFHPDGMPRDMLKYRGDGEAFVAGGVSKLGYKAIYHPLASVEHWVPRSRMTLEYIENRAFADGITQSYTDLRKKLIDGVPETKSFILKDLKARISLLFSDQLRVVRYRAYKKGYEFHQQQIRQDPKLLAWVLKENYL